ncbi:hypothetical protein DENSPDRAFT_886843 [Dentipellis sp. KUC8613]|nr:hypothetical protein DENSPDRAFT_886843 [Dentipellis sp. KUC8613]
MPGGAVLRLVAPHHPRRRSRCHHVPTLPSHPSRVLSRSTTSPPRNPHAATSMPPSHAPHRWIVPGGALSRSPALPSHVLAPPPCVPALPHPTSSRLPSCVPSPSPSPARRSCSGSACSCFVPMCHCSACPSNGTACALRTLTAPCAVSPLHAPSHRSSSRHRPRLSPPLHVARRRHASSHPRALVPPCVITSLSLAARRHCAVVARRAAFALSFRSRTPDGSRATAIVAQPTQSAGQRAPQAPSPVFTGPGLSPAELDRVGDIYQEMADAYHHLARTIEAATAKLQGN